MGGQLRAWCQSVGLLKSGQQFTARRSNFSIDGSDVRNELLQREDVPAKKFADTDTTAEKCPAGQLYDEAWAQLEAQPHLLTDPGLAKAAREFVNLIKTHDS
jgi:hypothetical protein